MKQLLFCLSIFFITSASVSAQKIVYVDTEYILENMTEYSEAQLKLDEFTSTWNDEIKETELALIDRKAAFKQNELLMPEVRKIEEQEAIQNGENELLVLKRKRFGTKGDLYKKQQDLIKPIQDKVYSAIKQMSEYRDYDMVLDKSTGVSILFVKPKLDVSDEVLRIINSKN